ncbi:hypothetical protein SAMN02745126_04101 [Enhydrobacter aerosaccus]|uniref:Uncharacterized protein n=1 Tax=Enhydrobacter aerosaccus TaxID=225324 RepID=A0A1T4RW12_9HYPH|nr:hypothetical protein [Enhydrobacter aerosaccus]SKA20194.1 hypothetical protein SAMN02745126_04101 [Enhydrobacter aerosaccus]
MRKMVQIAPSSLEALALLQSDSGKTFQALMDEAIADLLKKHKRPVGMKEMFAQSLARGGRPAKRG